MDYRVREVSRIEGHREAFERLRDSADGLLVPELEPNVTEAELLVEDGEPVLAYLPLPAGVAELRRAVQSIPYGETVRQATGLRNKSTVFGMSPRKLYQKRESCRPTALAVDRPDEHAVLVWLGDLCREMLEELAPEVVDRDRMTMEPVEPEWRLADRSTWTSGVVNNTTVLPYHVDGANFPTWSSMPVLRRDVVGGHLHLPEYGLVVACRDGWVVSFNGHDLIHGVTPMRTTTRDAYRISVVYYSLRGMKDCFTYAVESAAGAIRRTDREDGIAAALKGEQPFEFQP